MQIYIDLPRTAPQTLTRARVLLNPFSDWRTRTAVRFGSIGKYNERLRWPCRSCHRCLRWVCTLFQFLNLLIVSACSIGAAICNALGRLPLKALALHFSQSAQAAENLRDSLNASFPTLTLTLHQAELSQPSQCAKLVEEVLQTHGTRHSGHFYFKRRCGRTNNRHLVIVLKPMVLICRDVTLEDFDHTLNVNLRPSFLLTKGLVPQMRAQKWGRIVFVSSIAAYGGGINGPHYAASKGGLTGLMKNLSTRLAEYNISVCTRTIATE